MAASSDFSTKRLSSGIEFGYPISEFQGLQFGIEATRSDLLTRSDKSAQQAQDWVMQNGSAYSHGSVDGSGNSYTSYGSKFTTLELTAGWHLKHFNRGRLPDRGQKQVFTLSSTVPGMGVEYWIADYEFLQYVPLWERFTGVLNLHFAYGDSLGSTRGLPPYHLFFAGGPETVRGYHESGLGPRDNYGNAYGGNLLAVARTEVIIPMPARFETSARLSLFHDIGNVFSTGHDTRFFGQDGVTPVTYNFNFANLRRSAGVSIEWLAPLGLFRFSYALPLNASKGGTVRYPDDKSRFQFSIGPAF